MSETQSKRIAGDVFLGRYMPNAGTAEREEARQNLYAFVAALLRIARRSAGDEYEAEIRAASGQGVE